MQNDPPIGADRGHNVASGVQSHGCDAARVAGKRGDLASAVDNLDSALGGAQDHLRAGPDDVCDGFTDRYRPLYLLAFERVDGQVT